MKRTARVLALTASAVLSVGCNDEDPSGPGSVESTLRFTRADESPITFANDAFLFAWCGPWEEDYNLTPSLQILVGGPAVGHPHWHLRALVADVTVGDAASFPNDFPGDRPAGVDIFVFDPPNELSTADGRSGGSLTFQQFQCDAMGEVQFSIDAVIGSEFGDGQSIRVEGDFRAPIGAPPSFNSGARR